MKKPFQTKDNWKATTLLVVSIMFYSTLLATSAMGEDVSRITIIVASQSSAEFQEPVEPTPPPYIPQENKPPVADAGGPYYGYINQTIVLNASKSFDPDGKIIGYRWDLNNDGLYDTEWLTQPITTYTYTKTGNYTIKLQVKDNNNTLANDTTVVHITSLKEEKILPIPLIIAPNIAFSNQNITFDASKSFDIDGEITNYTWIFEENQKVFGVKVNYSFETAGNKSIVLKITDNDNLANYTIFNIKIISIIKEIAIENTLYYLVDTDGDNQINAIANSTDFHLNPVNRSYYDDQLVYLIDIDNDGIWDYIYYYEQNKIKPYTEKEIGEKSLNLNLYLIILSISAALIIAILLLKNSAKRKNKK